MKRNKQKQCPFKDVIWIDENDPECQKTAQEFEKRFKADMQRQRDAYYIERNDLLLTQFGKWIAFVNGQSTGFYDTRKEAIDDGYRKAHDVHAILITRIGYEKESHLIDEDALGGIVIE